MGAAVTMTTRWRAGRCPALFTGGYDRREEKEGACEVAEGAGAVRLSRVGYPEDDMAVCSIEAGRHAKAWCSRVAVSAGKSAPRGLSKVGVPEAQARSHCPGTGEAPGLPRKESPAAAMVTGVQGSPTSWARRFRRV